MRPVAVPFRLGIGIDFALDGAPHKGLCRCLENRRPRARRPTNWRAAIDPKQPFTMDSGGPIGDDQGGPEPANSGPN